MDGTALLQHLLRRAGFGASAADLATFGGLSYAQAVDRLVNYDQIPDDVDSKIGQAGYVGTTSNGQFSPNAVLSDAQQRWLFRMTHSQRPLQEKMTLFWHNYFATGESKVASQTSAQNGVRLMAGKASDDPVGQRGQVEFFRDAAVGNFRDLLVAVAQDPAMLIWLDGNTNTKAQPQENFGRELMELFSRGVGYYTEDDVYAAARVFTGWNLGRSGNQGDPGTKFTFQYNATQHETSAKTFSFPIYSNGSKTIPARSATDGIQDGIDLINALAMHPETATRLAGKLYSFFVSETSSNPGFVNTLATTYLQNGSNIKPVLQQLFLSPEFQDASAQYARYAWPVEFVVRAMKETGWTGFSVASAINPLLSMGQELYEPPNVAGWVLGANWFSSGAMLARMNFASTLASNQKFRLATDAAAAPGAKASPQALVNYLLTRLTPDLTSDTYADLLTYAASNVTWTGSDTQLQTKGSGVAHLVLGSAGYQVI